MLTVLVFWSWVLLLPRLPPSSRSLRLLPWASILLDGPLDIAWICCPQLPHHPYENGTHSTCFYSAGGHTPKTLFFKPCFSASTALSSFCTSTLAALPLKDSKLWGTMQFSSQSESVERSAMDPPKSSFPCLFGFPCLFPFQGIPCNFDCFSLISQGF